MKILHVNNPANAAWRLAQAQRRLGHTALVMAFGESPYGFPADVVLPAPGPRGPGPLVWAFHVLSSWRFLQGFDVLHVHMGIRRSQWPIYWWLKRRAGGKTLVLHFHGSDLRTGSGLHHRGLADRLLVATPDLLQFLPGSIWVPNPIELPPEAPPVSNECPRFCHFPTRPDLKGTGRILALFREAFGSPSKEANENGTLVRYKTPSAELWVAQGMAHQEVLRIMRGSDAVVDQYSAFGSYGYVAIEAMAHGKPVLSTFRQELFPGCPVISLEREPVQELRRIAADAEYRSTKGREGREYAARVHDAIVVARRVLSAYGGL